MKIVILGGGNIGSLLIGDLGSNKENQISLYTSNGNLWGDTVSVFDNNNNLLHTGVLYEASDNKESIFSNAEMVVSTLPSHIFPKVFKEIESYIPSYCIFAMMPGSGGGEYLCNSLIDRGCTILGFQRVHGIARIKEKGKSVYSLGKKDNLFISTITKAKDNDIKSKVEKLFNIPTLYLENYLNITLTPSNPILHTARLFSLFNKPDEVLLNKPALFYEEWDDDSSKVLLACDEELKQLCKRISFYKLDVSAVVPLSEYYESLSAKAFTRKIQSIEAFKNIEAPMIKTKIGYIPNLNSRYFKEDFLYGLAIIKSCCVLFDVSSPNIDRILKWYSNIFNIELYKDGYFCTKNNYNLIMPHLIFKNIKSFVAFYKKC